jgi:putative PEP-CTERM system histidine kinase
MGGDLAALTTWSYGLAALGYGLMAVFLLGQSKPLTEGSQSRARAMIVAVSLTLLWSLLVLGYSFTGRAIFYPISMVADTLRYGAWYVFILALLKPSGGTVTERQRLGGWLGMVAGAVMAAALAVQILLGSGIDGGGMLARLALILWPSLAIVALFLLEQLFRNVAVDSRWNIKPLCLGLAGAFLFDLYLFSDALLFARLDADAVGVRGFVHALVVPLLAVSAVRSRDWARKIRLSQKVVMHTTTLLTVGGYLLFMAGIGYYVRYFGGEWGRALQLALFFAALLALAVLAFSGAMRAKLRVLVGKHFFRYRYDYREEWLKFTRTLAAQNSPQAMGEQVIRGLADMVESPAGCLWLWDASRHGYRQFARWNMPESEILQAEASALCQFLLGSGWVINLEEFRSLPSRYEALELPDWLSEMENAWLVVPLMVGSDLTGFVVLGSSRTQVDVNWEVNDLLRTAGCQAAGFLAQMLATEALLEARKFDAFNRMSAFVVHDLKNIVSQLSLMLRNAERHKDNPEFQQDMLMTVEHSVERMRQLMLQLREGATPAGTTAGVDLAALFARVQTAKQRAGHVVELQVSHELAVRGDGDRLERVFGHLVQNSLDAIEIGGRVWVKLEREGGRARVEVGDTGHGMSPEFIRERLFKPFQTTKQAGMGIGAYESFQYIRELGGEIAVDSEVNVGTRISVLLPLFEVTRGSDLMRREAA